MRDTRIRCWAGSCLSVGPRASRYGKLRATGAAGLASGRPSVCARCGVPEPRRVTPAPRARLAPSRRAGAVRRSGTRALSCAPTSACLRAPHAQRRAADCPDAGPSGAAQLPGASQRGNPCPHAHLPACAAAQNPPPNTPSLRCPLVAATTCHKQQRAATRRRRPKAVQGCVAAHTHTHASIHTPARRARASGQRTPAVVRVSGAEGWQVCWAPARAAQAASPASRSRHAWWAQPNDWCRGRRY